MKDSQKQALAHPDVSEAIARGIIVLDEEAGEIRAESAHIIKR
jgi:hypothetical protein